MVLFLRKDTRNLFISLCEKHTGLLVGYESIAEYHKDMDTVVIKFNNTASFDGYNWNIAEIKYGRIVKIVQKRTLDN